MGRKPTKQPNQLDALIDFLEEDTTKQLQQKIDDAIKCATTYGPINDSSNRMWVIDQMVRLLAGNDYLKIITTVKNWDVGASPMKKQIVIENTQDNISELISALKQIAAISFTAPPPWDDLNEGPLIAQRVLRKISIKD